MTSSEHHEGNKKQYISYVISCIVSSMLLTVFYSIQNIRSGSAFNYTWETRSWALIWLSWKRSIGGTARAWIKSQNTLNWIRSLINRNMGIRLRVCVLKVSTDYSSHCQKAPWLSWFNSGVNKVWSLGRQTVFSILSVRRFNQHMLR